jgi:pyridinium-3,5-bisthiocarboxylic acid mononucleotide nickel chelatase
MSSLSSPETTALPPAAALAIHLDLVGGLAGDMFVAAIVDALPALAAPVLAELAKLQPAGHAPPSFRDGHSGGLRVCRFGSTPVADGAHVGGALAAHGHPHSDGAAGQPHVGTAYATLRDALASAPLAAATREHALALLELLADAEARAHGIGIEDVHFHELADWDSLLDLVAAGCIAGMLEGARWTASAPPLGGGSVRTAHGLLPVPTPATSALLTGYPWRDDGIGGERVTPTGAAILRHLVPAADCDARRESGRLVATGCGAGTRDLPGLPNVVRALVFERSATEGADAVTLLEFDVDDMSGEEIALAADRLRESPGVVDVSIGSRLGKKGRPVADFRVLAQPRSVEAVVRACFAETSTLGLRVRDERRRILARAEVAPAVDGTRRRVKVATRPDGERTAKTAHDDVATSGGLAARRRARAAAERIALGKDDP